MSPFYSFTICNIQIILTNQGIIVYVICIWHIQVIIIIDLFRAYEIFVNFNKWNIIYRLYLIRMNENALWYISCIQLTEREPVLTDNRNLLFSTGGIRTLFPYFFNLRYCRFYLLTITRFFAKQGYKIVWRRINM